MTWPPQDPRTTRPDLGTDTRRGPVDPPPWASAPPDIPQYVPPPPPHQSPYPHPGQVTHPAPGRPEDHAPQPHPSGYPAPAPRSTGPAASTAPRYADWGERVGASLVDYAILLLPLFVLAPVSAVSESVSGLAGMLWCGLAGYLAWLNGSKGQSPGKALMGLKVVRDADGTTLGGPVGLVRGALLVIMGALSGGLLFALAVLWPAWDARRQALHDKFVSATVVAGYPRARLSRQIFLP